MDLHRAETFIWSNARLLDRLRFAHLFQGHDRESVRRALAAYQNDDGGFGNGLEPDLRAPLSQPQPVEFALRILDEIDALADPLVGRLCGYLQTITTADGGVPFVLYSASDYPHAPWWSAGPNPPASINPTAGIAGLLHKHRVAHAWLPRATEYAWRVIEGDAELGGYDYLAIFLFLEFVPDRARAQAAFERLSRQVLESGQITLDPNFTEHGFMPLDFAPTPSSPQRSMFDDDTIERHLDGLAMRQQPDGGFTIGWEPPSPLAVLEWRGYVTVQALKTLRAYGRI